MSTDLFLGEGFDLQSPAAINFIENRLHDLSPFSAHEVEIDGVVYKTVEHAYQTLRVIPKARTAIMHARCPMDAWREGQKCKQNHQMLDGYDKDSLMEKLMRAKLDQHNDICEVLKMTGDRELLKVYPTDSYWGTGPNGEGENKMGKLWMKLRSEIS